MAQMRARSIQEESSKKKIIDRRNLYQPTSTLKLYQRREMKPMAPEVLLRLKTK
jgi:hypothetical protein